MSAPEPPLYVDLDGTLVSTDLLHESFLSAVKSSPWVALQSIGWLLQGRPRLKEELAARAHIDVATLPYRAPVIDFLRQERARGRRLVLMTASWVTLAEAVAKHLDLFDEVIATSAEGNMKGEAKALRIAQECGPGTFDYVGDSVADLPVWRQCRHAYIVSGSDRLARRLPPGVEAKHVLASEAPGGGAALRALRPHQWAKNLLVFIPLITAHRWADVGGLVSAMWAFVAFSLVASSAYIVNDLLDLAADRAHPRKRARPFASGQLGIPEGVGLAAGCIVAALGIVAMLPPLFGFALLAYFALTLVYTFVLKRVAMLDAVALATLYALRLIAGTFAIHALLSFWLIAFAMFVFFSLALLKRYAELAATDGGAETLPGRGYAQRDAQVVLAVGAASAMVSGLVLALYINGEAAKNLYSHPEMLWLLCPMLLYWMSRAWLIGARGQMHDDPVLFAVRDPASYVVAVAGGTVLFLAT